LGFQADAEPAEADLVIGYTQADADNVRAARLALARGQRKVRVTYGDRTVEYAQEDSSKLRELHREILADLAAQAGKATHGVIRVTSCKGD